MLVILRVFMVYFLVLGLASVLLLPFYSSLPQTYVFGFGLLALPTMPVIKVLFPIFEGALSTDSIMLLLISAVSLIYAGAAYFSTVLLKKRGFGEGARESTRVSSSI